MACGNGIVCNRDSVSQMTMAVRITSVVWPAHIPSRRARWVDIKSAVSIVRFTQQGSALANHDQSPTFLGDGYRAHKAAAFFDSMKPLCEIVLFPSNVSTSDSLQPGMYFVHLDSSMVIVVDSRRRRGQDDEISGSVASGFSNGR